MLLFHVSERIERNASHFIVVRCWRRETTAAAAAAAECSTIRRRPRPRRRRAGYSGRSWKYTMRFFAAWKIPATKKPCNLASTISFGLTLIDSLRGHFPRITLRWLILYSIFIYILLSFLKYKSHLLHRFFFFLIIGILFLFLFMSLFMRGLGIGLISREHTQ